MAGEDHRQRISAFQPAECRARRRDRIHAAPQVEIDELRHRLGVGLGGELLAFRFKFGAQFGMVLDDAVVHDRYAGSSVRMRVALGRRAMRRPARMADAGRAGQWQTIQHGCEIAKLALGSAALDVAVDQSGDPGAVVAAIFQPAQRIQDQRCGLP